MKKFIMLLTSFVLIAFGAQSQRVYTVTNYADTLTNAETVNYPVGGATPITFSNPHYCAAQVYVDHITGSSDSTHVRWQGSLDNSTYYTLGSTYILYTSDSPTTWKEASFGTTDGGFLWVPTVQMTWKYMRMQVQHYATGTVRVKAYFQLF